MLSVYTRHHPDCAKKDDSTYRRCRCPKWLDGTLPGRHGRFRTSAKTKSWEQAELLARKYENSALSGEDLKPAKMPTVKEAVGIFLADAEARGLAPATLQKLRGIFQVQLVGFAEESGVTFLREFNPRNLTEWRQTSCLTWLRSPFRALTSFRHAGQARSCRGPQRLNQNLVY